MRSFICILFLAITSSSCTNYYYIVRHAEKTNSDCPSPLAPAGVTRADVLRDSLISKGIDSVFVSTCVRTQQTGQPLATAIGVTMVEVQPTDAAATALLPRLKRIGGKSMLIVGHANTVPIIVQGLSGHSIAPIPDSDYDNMYIVKRKRVLWLTRTYRHITYGAPTN